jgi:hypothetical protein
MLRFSNAPPAEWLGFTFIGALFLLSATCAGCAAAKGPGLRPEHPGLAIYYFRHAGFEFQRFADTIVVWEVYSGGSAERGGLRRGDVVLEVNGKSLVDESAVRTAITDMGMTANIFILRRDGARIELVVDYPTCVAGEPKGVI